MTKEMLMLQLKAVYGMNTLLTEITDIKHRECLGDVAALVSGLMEENSKLKGEDETDSN